MQSNSELQSLLAKIREGSMVAACQLVDLYLPHIYRVVRRRLSQQLRANFDSQDFAQMMWMSFFRNPKQIHSFKNPDELIGFFARMAANKIAEEARRLTNQKNDVRRLTSLDAGPEPVAAKSKSPRPSEIAIAHEQLDRMLKQQPLRVREIARLRIMGEKTSEIAARLQIDARSVRKAVTRLAAVNIG